MNLRRTPNKIKFKFMFGYTFSNVLTNNMLYAI